MPRAIVPIQYQRRLVEVGRIRLGRKVATNGGKSRPAKLDKFRLTSRDKARLDAAAAIYGGTVEPWEEGDAWQLFTDSDAFDVAVVPQQALSVSYELWGQIPLKGGGKSPVICLRRCDGVQAMVRKGEDLVDSSCLCAQEEDTSCRPTTRVSVILTKVPGLGVWRVESHGWNALSEMQGQVELLEALTATGRPVRARLRLDKRTTPTARGTNRFAVPVLDIDHTVDQVLTALGQPAGTAAPVELEGAAPALAPAPPAQLEAPAAERNPDITPVAAAQPTSAPSVREQLEQGTRDLEEPPAPRRNAAEPIRPTGVQPRTVDQLADQDEAPDSDTDLEGEDSGPAAAAPSSGGALPLPSMVAIWIGEVHTTLRERGVEVDTADAFRHSFLEAFSEGAYASATKVPNDNDTITALRAACVRMRRGAIFLDSRVDPAVFRNAVTRLPTNDPGGQSKARRGGPVDPDSADVIDITEAPSANSGGVELPAPDATDDTVALFWKRHLDQVDGIGPAKLLGYARSVNVACGVEAPNSLGDIRDPQLSERCLAWLSER